MPTPPRRETINLVYRQQGTDGRKGKPIQRIAASKHLPNELLCDPNTEQVILNEEEWEKMTFLEKLQQGIDTTCGAPRENTSWQAYMPKEVHNTVALFFHDHHLAGHPGTGQMWRMVERHYRWPGTATDVKEYVRECTICQ
ncbi:hypothetical protein PR048_019486 [Dryococelus australis]|uniref:Integrase zinc-binding domain-containing protein n=1 Tax=Dryococelus australis TaxID=614101 RepID=A0ABQ9H3P2_9NEOP|nr:hypothetical protein PR048_019486 [Dryococelus australis]